MNIGINALILKKNNTGTGYYTKLLVQELAKFADENFFVFVPDAALLDIHAANVHRVALPLAARGTLGRIFAEQFLLKKYIKKYAIQVLHSTSFVIPFAVSNIPQVVTVHDMFHELFKKTIKPLNRLYYSLFFNRSIKKADAVIAVSQNTKSDIARILSINPEKINMIYPGLNPVFADFRLTEEIQRQYQALGLPEKFLLYVGSLEPRKNLEKLIDAYSLIQDRIDHKLVIIGIKKWKTSSLFNKIKRTRLENKVIFTGFIDEFLLPLAYKNATIFMFPSLYEGFGFPVLESMSMGTPVITSDNSSLREIGAGSVYLINPCDETELTRAIMDLLENKIKRKSLVRNGFAAVTNYTWVHTALKTLDLYYEVVKKAK